MNVLVGTQFYATRRADVVRRQAQCAASLVNLRGADVVNLQWPAERFDWPAIETVVALEQDSRGVAGSPGPPRPILSELFAALGSLAERRGLRYFLFVNSDIIVTQAAVDAVTRLGKQTYAISRMDVDADTGRDAGIVTAGIDAFGFDVDWWRAERARFRPYVLGEWFYDCVFAAIMMTFGDGVILNRAGEIRHEQHPRGPSASSRSALFNGYLAALDSREFTLWAQYHAGLETLRARGATEAEEHAFAKKTFVWRPSPFAAAWHAGRCVRARWSYTRACARLSATAAGAPR